MREDHEGFTLFYKQHFHKQRQIKLTKNQAKAKQHLETELLLFENYSLSSSSLSSKNGRRILYSKKCTKTSASVLTRLYDQWQ